MQAHTDSEVNARLVMAAAALGSVDSEVQQTTSDDFASKVCLPVPFQSGCTRHCGVLWSLGTILFFCFAVYT